ncbi:hypothetical protein [Cellulomonas carbonis]|uniref:Uncharacterized protein n=1 Tax=Cellulomonas carbonis T26 TaxID=947969 RepID=A0A0A0BY43_9CELL|nr:hypothetical protein [Cellulomonas carbonis]KGM12099.1 hypothetical protein N868_02765 [Cellulomonas carbonis T26]GGC08224.1 hypothetical protein GCM10010972_21870 [Cellulomonas carbonis]
MTAATPSRTSAAGARPGAVVATASYLLRTQLRVVAWALALVVVGLAVTVVVLERVQPMEVSILQFGRQGLVWFPFSLMVIVATAYLGPHVAMGLTRRSLGHAAILVAGATALVLGTAVAALMVVERGVYGALGWEHGIDAGLVGLSGSWSVPLLLVDHVLLVLAGQVAGLLVGAAYKRWHWTVATLALPVTVSPALVASVLLDGELGAPVDGSAGGVALRVTLVVATTLVAAVAYLAVQRRTAVAPAAT